MTALARRYREIYELVRSEQRFLSRNAPITMRAILGGVTASGAPQQVVDTMLRIQADFKDAVPWYSGLTHNIRLAITVMLMRTEDDVPTFMSALAVARQQFREAKVRKSEAYEVFATLIHRHLHDGAAVTAQDAQRIKAIYEACKDHHWWLTGPEDLPCCVLLASRAGTPEAIAGEAEAIYQALRKAGHTKGEVLQTASFFLTLAGTNPDAVAARFSALADAFRDKGLRIFAKDSDELAVLTALEQPVDEVIQTVLSHRDVLSGISGIDRQTGFEIAVSTATLALTQDSKTAALLVSVKSLQDVYAILQEQIATATATTGAVATT